MYMLGAACCIVLAWYIDAQSRTPTRRASIDPAARAIHAPGRVEGLTEEIGLRARLHGRIVELSAAEGQAVRKEELLLRLDDRRLRHDVQLALAELEQAEARLQKLLNGARVQQREEARAMYQARLAELEQAQVRWNRVQRLRADQAVSLQAADDQYSRVKTLQAQVDAAKARMELLAAPAREDEVRIARAQIEAARARVEIARVELEKTELVAPFAGRVLSVNVDPGELTGPEDSQPAIVLADTRQFRVRAFVEELDAPRVKVGMPAKVLADGLPGKTFSGRVTRLSPRMTRKELRTHDPGERLDTKSREVWIDLEDGAGLVFGLRVDVVIPFHATKPPAEPADTPHSVEPLTADRVN